ncbi:MAG TPA: helix-turn-helix domain-containing protein [Solirubrobacteraceae bacterium]|nr:helix-turn-helix domain-containing protein [Solirubrobacteraceae bacterium]
MTVTRAQTAHSPDAAVPDAPAAAIATLRRTLDGQLDDLADTATRLILAEIPGYRDATPALRDDVRSHVLSHLRISLSTFSEARPVTREELLFVRGHAAKRVGHIPIAEFVNAFYVGERVLWEAALASAHDDDSRRAALVFASHLPRYFEVATTHAAEVYIEAEEQLAATGERIRRDLLEDLVAGLPLAGGPRMDAARAAGLEPGVPCLVVSAAATPTPVDESLLRSAATALARAIGGVLAPLTVVRHGKIDLVARAPDRGVDEVRQRLERAQRRLEAGGLPLAIGVSTVVDGLDQIADAYREAELARASLDSAPGVVALTGMSAFDYLTLRRDPTASRLIPAPIQEFVDDDVRQGGVLIATLSEYVACDLNARRAAERLHIHVNTAHYRLGKIAERTGCDLHRFSDLAEILIAARFVPAAVVARAASGT